VPTYEVTLKRPVLFSVTVEADDVAAACREAWEIFVDDARSLNAADFDAKRQPSTPDDSGDARSEARYEYSEHDALDDQLREERSQGGAESPREGTEA
jgi:hypothetical protein